MNVDGAYEGRPGEQLAIGLGWFSIALGIAELAAPHSVARFIGVPPDSTTVSVLRSYGAREVGNGLAILAQPDRAAWMWSRVAGDALDLATLTNAMGSPETDRGRAMFATAAVLGVAALDVVCARQLSQEEDGFYEYGDEQMMLAGTAAATRRRKTVHVAEAITINQPIERVEERWNTLEAMPKSLRNLGTTQAGETTYSVVHFRRAPGARGTEIHVELEYQPTGGTVGAAVARLFGHDPASQIREDLRRFKQILETGEIALSDGPSLRRAAQPAADPQQIRTAAGLEVGR